MVWFCGSPEGNKGPFTRTQMEDLIQAGVVGGDSYVWREGLANWTRLEETGDFAPPELQRPARTATPAEPQPARAQAAAQPAAQPNVRVAAQPAAHANVQVASQQPTGHTLAQNEEIKVAIPNAQNQDDYLDGVFVGLVRSSWARYRKRQVATEVDEVLVGAVITATLDNGYALIDLESTGSDHYLRFEKLESGQRIIFKLTHHAESLLTSAVLGHEASVRIGYGERIRNFGVVWKAIKQEMKGGYIAQAEPGIITVDGDISSQYVYVEVGLLWDINEYLDENDPYIVKYPRLTQDVGATIHALQKYLHGRIAG